MKNGRVRGFAFITMKTQEAAQNTLKELDNFEFLGRRMVVKMATDKKTTGRSGGSSTGDRGRRTSWN